MKILFISAFPPNRLTAGQNYSRQLLNDLSKEHDVDLVYWSYPNHIIDISPKVKILKEFNVKKNHYFSCLGERCLFPLFTKRYSKSVKDYLRSEAGKYDLLYFDFSQVFVYSTEIDHPLKIGMSHDVIGQKFSRLKLFRLLIPWVRYSEKICLSSFKEVLTFSKKDSAYIESHYSMNSLPVPFYIDSGIFGIDLDRVTLKNYFVMYGAWNRRENQESIKWLLKQDQQLPYPVKIIGGSMPEELQAKIKSNSSIEYIGFVDNPYPIIAQAKGLIAPLFHGAGVKVKVIESLSLGTPVIGTDITFEGINNINYCKDKNALINISSLNFYEAISQLFSLSVKDKKYIQESFIKNYNSTKFMDHLREYKIM